MSSIESSGPDSVDQTSEAETENQDSVRTELEYQAIWAGPLPPPRILEAYEDLVPGAAREIFDARKNESEHRREMERTDLKWSIFESIFGKVLAFLFVMSGLVFSLYSALNDAEIFASVLGAGTLGTVAWAFVKQRRSSE